MRLLLAFVAVPLIEIALFIQVGGLIGLWPTLLIVLATAILGSWLVRTQGAHELGRLRQSFSTLQDPAEPLANGAMILFAGALLLTPGFFTDACGFALLVPAIRARVFRAIKARVRFTQFEMGPQPQRPAHPDDRVIDGEFETIDPEKRPTHGPSGWTRH
ncbi:FxsA family protein [Loktanella sp. DJP18]|uniref:FxsA family protein n=1 Tax=Loktanella sp. DJP18 TaxID=3409788 RepID=UPI003BB649ED